MHHRKNERLRILNLNISKSAQKLKIRLFCHEINTDSAATVLLNNVPQNKTNRAQ